MRKLIIIIALAMCIATLDARNRPVQNHQSLAEESDEEQNLSSELSQENEQLKRAFAQFQKNFRFKRNMI